MASNRMMTSNRMMPPTRPAERLFERSLGPREWADDQREPFPIDHGDLSPTTALERLGLLGEEALPTPGREFAR